MIDVLIVGAGPTGLILANLLKRAGLTYRIIDQNQGPAKESRAIGIQARTMELFDKLGIVDEFLQRGTRAGGARMYLHGDKKLEINVGDMARADTKYPYIFFHSQSDTEMILSRGLEVERSTRLIGFSQNKDFVVCEVEDSFGKTENFKVRFLCGCDGSHSFVRKKLNMEFKGDSYSSEFLMADAKVDWTADSDKVHVFLETGKIAVYFPLIKNERGRVLTVSSINKEDQPDTDETTSYPASLEEIEKGFQEAGQIRIKLSDPVWVTRYHVHHRSVDRMREGNVFLLGDAAHIHSPVGAQGMNTGIQDANNLAWKLKAAIQNPLFAEGILETYQLERHPIAKKLIHFTDKFFSAAVSQNKVFLKFRNLFLPVIGKTLMSFPAGKLFLFRFISQLNIRYSPNLVTRPDALKLLEAGSRVPNVMLNEQYYIHDFLKGYEFEALAFKRESFTFDEIKMIYQNMNEIGIHRIHFFRLNTDEDGTSIKVREDLFDWFKVENHGLFLVRPDGYVGYCSNDLNKKPDYPALNREENGIFEEQKRQVLE